MTKLPDPWHQPDGRDPNAEAAALKRRFRRVSDRHFGRRLPSWLPAGARRGVPFWMVWLAVLALVAIGLAAGRH